MRVLFIKHTDANRILEILKRDLYTDENGEEIMRDTQRSKV